MDKKKFEPITVELKKGKTYLWCQCGLSKNQPFCDGSHNADFCEPELIEPIEDTRSALCVCKKSKNKPYCDGTHKTL